MKGTPTAILDDIEIQAAQIIGDGQEHMAMIFCLHKQDDGLMVRNIVGVVMPEREHREAMCRQLAPVLDNTDGYIFITEGWTVNLPPQFKNKPFKEVEAEAVRMGPASLHPERVEVLMLSYVSRLGEQINRVYHIIKRPDAAISNGRPYLKLVSESTEPGGGIFGNLYEYTMEDIDDERGN